MMSLGVANGQALSLESLHRKKERREFEDDLGVVDAPRGHRGSEALLQLEQSAESCEERQDLRETPTRPPASPASQGRRKAASLRRQVEVHPGMTLTGVRGAGQETMGSTWRGVNTTRGASS